MKRKNASQPKRNRLKKTVELASFPELNPNPVSEVDLDGQIYYLNPAARRLFPTLKARGLDHPWLADWKSVADIFRNRKTQSMLRQVTINRRCYQQAINYVAGIQRVRIYGLDITEREQAEQALRAAKDTAENEKLRLQAVMEALPVGVAITDAHGGNVQSNRMFESVWGGTRPPTREVSDYVGYKAWWLDTGKPVLPEEWGSAQAVQKGESVVGQLMEIERFDGARGYVINSAAPVRDAGGKIVGAAVAIQDITELRRIQDALRESEEKYRRLIENVNDLVCDVDAKARYRFVNSQYEQVLGYARDELVGKYVRDLIHPDDLRLSAPSFKKLVDGRSISRNEWRFKHKSGEWRWFDCVAQTYEKSPGETHVVVISRDITDRKKKEAELHRLNRTLRALSNINQAMMRVQSEAEFLQQVCQIVVEDCGHAMVWIGYAEEDKAKTVRPVAYAGFETGYLETLKITWADTERGRGPTGTAIRTGKPSACRNMLTDPNFEPWREEALKRGYASSIVFPLMASGKAFGAITIYSREPDPFSEDEVKLLSELAEDLAFGIAASRLRVAHRQAEEALRRSEERYRSLFNAMTEGFALHEIICDEEDKPCDYRFLDMNPAFERLTGLKREQVIGKTMREVLPEDDPAWIEAYGKVALTGEPVHFENYSLALNRHYEVFAYRPAPRQFAVVFSEITERKRSEELLRKNEATLRGILDATQESIWLFSPNGIILLGNETALSRLRRPAEQVIGKSFSQLMPEELARSRQMHLNKVVETGRPVELVDERAGIIFHHHFYPIKDADGRVIQIVAFSRDITERERAEEALRESEERFKVIASSTPDHLLVQDRDLRYTFVVNPQLGLTEQEMVGKTDYDFLSKDDAENLTRIKRQVLETGNAVHVEVPLISPKGETQFFSGSYVPKHNAEGQIDGLIGYFQNVTDLKRAEEALRASRDDLERTVAERTAELQSANVRLRSLTQDIVSTQEEERRRVSRELHDEAGQALTALKLSLQMMHDELPSGWAKYRQHLGDAVTLTDKTLEQIRMLAQDLRPPALDAAGLDATLEGLCREFAHRTQIQIHYNGTALPNLGPATICLYRFLQEALTNAARHGHATEIQVRFEKDAEHICLSVEDNGQGFDTQKVLSDQGNPKSMGLIGMQERINMVGGRLEISSNPGCGTRLIARVPLETA